MLEIESLRKRYDAFIDVYGTKDFFDGFADYFDFIGSKRNLARIVKNIFSQGILPRKKVVDARTKVFEKLTVIKSELQSYISKQRINNQLIKTAISQYEDCLAGTVIMAIGAGGVVGALHDQLRDVVEALYRMPEHREFASEYIEFKNEKRETINFFLPLQEMDRYLEILDDWYASQNTQRWGRLEYLLTLYRVERFGNKRLERWWEIDPQRKEAEDLTAEEQAMLAEWHSIEGSKRGIGLIYFIKGKVITSVKDLQEYISKQLVLFPKSKTLESLYLVTESLVPSTSIFLVLDGRFHSPIRCPVRNRKGEPTYMSKLYDIAYYVDAPGKRVNYSRQLADNINNGLFKLERVNQYLADNHLAKPTLVEKTSNNTLALKNDVIIKTLLIQKVPNEQRVLYYDKTN